jgi:hypothetical protein
MLVVGECLEVEWESGPFRDTIPLRLWTEVLVQKPHHCCNLLLHDTSDTLLPVVLEREKFVFVSSTKSCFLSLLFERHQRNLVDDM